jgi:transketolase
MLAPKYKLNNLVCFLDMNGSQNDGYVKDILPLNDMIQHATSFGWEAHQIDGHDETQLELTLGQHRTKPLFVILNTIKGKGVSFMESKEWHAKVPNETEYIKAKTELI